MDDVTAADAPEAPYAWKATSPFGTTSLLVGARPGDTFTDVTALTTKADYDAAVAALRGASPMSITRTITRDQFYQQLAAQNEITQDEAFAALTGTIPPEMMIFVNGLPADQQFNAKMKLTRPAFSRGDPFVATFGQAKGWTSDQIDALWSAAAEL